MAEGADSVERELTVYDYFVRTQELAGHAVLAGDIISSLEESGDPNNEIPGLQDLAGQIFREFHQTAHKGANLPARQKPSVE
jgi:hypothetical protein